MSDPGGAVDLFTFLRPGWLAVVPVMLLLWWRIRTRAARPMKTPSEPAE